MNELVKTELFSLLSESSQENTNEEMQSAKVILYSFEIQKYTQGLHTFIVHLGPQSCRCPGLLSEAAFDCVMDALNWRMPYHLRAFHCSSPETADRRAHV